MEIWFSFQILFFCRCWFFRFYILRLRCLFIKIKIVYVMEIETVHFAVHDVKYKQHTVRIKC